MTDPQPNPAPGSAFAPGTYGTDAIEEASDPATWEIWPAPQCHREVLYQRFPEFTCRCPRSGYPDFATVHLVTIPDQKVVELKHLKLWLNSYRERTISHELATAEIIETLATTLGLAYGFILMEYTPRGNLLTLPMIEHRQPGLGNLDAHDPLAVALGNALRVRDRLIDLAVQTHAF
ncbi:MAG: preQ(1) synthase [Thermomicrobiales bacterium]